MAAFDLVASMYDPALKPRLLRMVVREHVPDDKSTFRVASDLSTVVSMIKIHNLLSESLSSMDQKLIDSWKSAVDSWVERLVLLLSSNTLDKCSVGIVLLGVTCQQCSTTRFLASYTDWFHQLLPHIQTGSHSLKVASCASISVLFTRLSGFQNVKKDGTSYAGKVIQPVLKLLHDENTAVWDTAVNLFYTLIAYFPFSIQRHYDSAEAAIVSKIFSGKCPSNMLKKLACCLALLPKSKGDEDSWSLLMQKILLSINCYLNVAFQGIYDDSKGNEVVRLLVPPGKDPPPPLGCNSLSGDSFDTITKSVEELSTTSVLMLMLCCSTMITSSRPHKAVVPVRALLALVDRVLMVDGSLSPSSLPFMTALQQELICSELPTLHSNSLDLFVAIIKSRHSYKFRSHVASFARLLSMYFKNCVSAELRVKVYEIAKLLMIAIGNGMTASLAQDVIDNALVDLNPVENESCAPPSWNPKDTKKELLQHRKKRKRTSVATSLQEQHDGHGSGGDSTNSYVYTPVNLRIAALGALETFLTLAGAFNYQRWRPKIDRLVITTATSSFKGPQTMEEKIFQTNEPAGVWADYQLAAFRALLASFLSAAGRPLYLAQGLELFRRGKEETGTKLAEFCAHALLATEVLMHPRVPPMDYSPANFSSHPQASYKIPENTFFDELELKKSSKIGTQGMEPNALDSDDSYERWVADGMEEAPVRDAVNETIDVEPTNDTSNHAGKQNSADGAPSTEMPMRSEHETTVAIADMDIIDQNDVNAHTSMNNSPVLSEPDRNEELERDKSSTSLPEEDDFPDIIDADPDSD